MVPCCLCMIVGTCVGTYIVYISLFYFLFCFFIYFYIFMDRIFLCCITIIFPVIFFFVIESIVVILWEVSEISCWCGMEKCMEMVGFEPGTLRWYMCVLTTRLLGVDRRCVGENFKYFLFSVFVIFAEVATVTVVCCPLCAGSYWW